MRIQTKPGWASTLREGFPIILKEEGVGGRLATCVVCLNSHEYLIYGVSVLVWLIGFGGET